MYTYCVLYYYLPRRRFCRGSAVVSAASAVPLQCLYGCFCGLCGCFCGLCGRFCGLCGSPRQIISTANNNTKHSNGLSQIIVRTKDGSINPDEWRRRLFRSAISWLFRLAISWLSSLGLGMIAYPSASSSPTLSPSMWVWTSFSHTGRLF